MFDSILTYVSKSQLKSTLADTTRVHALANSLREFVDLDVKDMTNGVKYGELCRRILTLPLPKQIAVVNALADDLRIPHPEYPDVKKASRTFRGRNQLASVLYAGYPTWLEKAGKNKDTIAGKRLSRYIREYEAEAGLRSRAVRVKRAVSFASFETLMINALPPEQETILAVLTRAKLDEPTLAKWVRRVKVAYAPSITARFQPEVGLPKAA